MKVNFKVLSELFGDSSQSYSIEEVVTFLNEKHGDYVAERKVVANHVRGLWQKGVLERHPVEKVRVRNSAGYLTRAHQVVFLYRSKQR